MFRRIRPARRKCFLETNLLGPVFTYEATTGACVYTPRRWPSGATLVDVIRQHREPFASAGSRTHQFRPRVHHLQLKIAQISRKTGACLPNLEGSAGLSSFCLAANARRRRFDLIQLQHVRTSWFFAAWLPKLFALRSSWIFRQSCPSLCSNSRRHRTVSSASARIKRVGNGPSANSPIMFHHFKSSVA